jgi:hypothetical protein
MNILFISFCKFSFFSASRLLHTNSFPCFCIIAHQGSQQTVQLKLDHYTGKRKILSPEKIFGIKIVLGADEFLAEVINGVQHADQILQYNR